MYFYFEYSNGTHVANELCNDIIFTYLFVSGVGEHIAYSVTPLSFRVIAIAESDTHVSHFIPIYFRYIAIEHTPDFKLQILIQ